MSDKDIEWLNWYNSLSKEEQWAVNYYPSQLLKVFGANEVSKVNIDDMKLKEDNNQKANKPARKAGNNAQTGVAGVAGVAGILTTASVTYGASKKD